MTKTPRPRLTPLDIKIIRYWLDRGHSSRWIADRTGISKSSVNNVRREGHAG